MVTIRKAKVADAEEIRALIEPFAARDEMLPRSLGEICENLRDYFVAEEDGRVVGCCALHIDTPELAEVKALAVAEDVQGRGIGRALVNACIQEAAELGLARVFALTYRPRFFERFFQFRLVEKNTLPNKVWNECIYCPKFPSCGEEALVLELRPSPVKEAAG
jgi:amino-acid N-acetyltransferase